MTSRCPILVMVTQTDPNGAFLAKDGRKETKYYCEGCSLFLSRGGIFATSKYSENYQNQFLLIVKKLLVCSTFTG